ESNCACPRVPIAANASSSPYSQSFSYDALGNRQLSRSSGSKRSEPKKGNAKPKSCRRDACNRAPWRMSVEGQKPPTSPALVCLLPPAAEPSYSRKMLECVQLGAEFCPAGNALWVLVPWSRSTAICRALSYFGSDGMNVSDPVCSSLSIFRWFVNAASL